MTFTPKYVSPTYAGEKIVCVTRSQQGEISHLYQRFDSRCKLHFSECPGCSGLVIKTMKNLLQGQRVIFLFYNRIK